MGLDVARVRGEVDEELMCPICSQVLLDPVAAPECEHAFCQPCISQWLARRPNCPVDRQPVQPKDLRPVPRILRNLLARLEVSCDNESSGCAVVCKLDLLSHHLKECEHNPKRAVLCDKGCGLAVPKDELAAHNCIKEMRSVLTTNEQKVAEMQSEMADVKYQLAEQRRDIAVLKDALRLTRTSSSLQSASVGSSSASGQSESRSGANVPDGAAAASSSSSSNVLASLPLAGSRTVTDQIQDDEVARWAVTLQVARVSRWGGMISTPDASLQVFYCTLEKF